MLILLTILITYFITTLFGHTVHFILHQRWAGRVHAAHMTHHLKLYPPDDFMSKEYRQAGKDSTPKFFAIAALPLVLTPIILWAAGVIPLSILITVIIVEGLMGFLHNYLHDSFHIEVHWLNEWIPNIFARWVRLHYQHHIDMSTNFGIFSFHWDRIFRTFRKNT